MTENVALLKLQSVQLNSDPKIEIELDGGMARLSPSKVQLLQSTFPLLNTEIRFPFLEYKYEFPFEKDTEDEALTTNRSGYGFVVRVDVIVSP
jgi:hypothetical protein